MEPRPARRPGDQILDRYVPHLTGADRELARERLQGLAKLLLRIAMRQVREEMQAADSRDSDSDRIISSTSPSSNP
jgi:hypothetical protein